MADRAPALQEGSAAARAGIVPGEPPGTLTLVDLQRAETDPAHSVVATVDAGCQPVRVVTAANGTQIWVTARASDDMLCFAAALLVTDPSHASPRPPVTSPSASDAYLAAQRGAERASARRI